MAARGGGRPEPDTVVSPASFDVARLAAGAAGDAVDRVLAGEDRTALCLVRPPGHHALARPRDGLLPVQQRGRRRPRRDRRASSSTAC